jgi:transposase
MGSRVGIDRNEVMLLPERVDDYVGAEHPVRALDLYVEGLDLGALGFSMRTPGSVGHPGYSESALLKLLIYGYLNQIRSSRRLESESHRNLEVIWLTGKLQPDHWTINEFRRKNLKAFKKTLKDFHRLCLALDLFGRELIAIDGSFFKARNSKARNFTEAKLKAMDARIEKAIDAYWRALEEAEKDQGAVGSEDGGGGDGEAQASMAEKLEKLRERRRQLKRLGEEARRSPSGQLSLSDADSRLLKKGTQSVVGHNVQMAVDGKHDLIVSMSVAQAGNDSNELEPTARAGCESLEIDPEKQNPVVIADGGYYNAAQIEQCERSGMQVHVPAGKKAVAGQGAFGIEAFTYDAEADDYRCPQGNRLRRHADHRLREITYRVYYESAACRDCPCLKQCTRGKYRKLQISEYREVEQKVAERMAQAPEIYRRRKEIAEHPFGTIKEIWGYRQFMLRGTQGVEGELALMAFCYNWKRVLAVLGLKGLLEALKKRAQNGPNPPSSPLNHAWTGSLAAFIHSWCHSWNKFVQRVCPQNHTAPIFA